MRSDGQSNARTTTSGAHRLPTFTVHDYDYDATISTFQARLPRLPAAC
jgi:hypothetical protein